MTEPNHWILKATVFLFLSSLVFSQGTQGEAPVPSAKTPELYFYALPSKQLFSLGESVVIGLELYSRSEQPILASRLQGDEFVSFKVIGPDGKELAWQGVALIVFFAAAVATLQTHTDEGAIETQRA